MRHKQLQKTINQEIARLKTDYDVSSAYLKMYKISKIACNAVETANPEKECTKELKGMWNRMVSEYQKGDGLAARKSVIADKLKLYRDRHALSQDELAAKIGVGRRQLIRWEKEETTPHNVFLRTMKDIGIM